MWSARPELTGTSCAMVAKLPGCRLVMSPCDQQVACSTSGRLSMEDSVIHFNVPISLYIIRSTLFYQFIKFVGNIIQICHCRLISNEPNLGGARRSIYLFYIILQINVPILCMYLYNVSVNYDENTLPHGQQVTAFPPHYFASCIAMWTLNGGKTKFSTACINQFYIHNNINECTINKKPTLHTKLTITDLLWISKKSKDVHCTYSRTS